MNDQLPKEREGAVLRFLYHTIPGRFCLKGLTHPLLSKCCGKMMDSSLSKTIIDPFIKNNRIDLSEYENCTYRSFNDFFTRQIKKEKRPIDMDPSHLIAPCDGLLSVYPIRKGKVLPVKQSAYTIAALLKNAALAEKFKDGTALVFRLCVNHYHRYIYADTGTKGGNIFLPGRLHTVRPIALREFPVFTENAREYTLIESGNFGTMIQMEVGAMLVGKIQNYHEAGTIMRGQEKGRFLYGGSTVILLLQKDAVVIDPLIAERSHSGVETPVKMGEKIGTGKRMYHCDVS